MKKSFFGLTALALVLGLAACGGNGGSTGTKPAPGPGPTPGGSGIPTEEGKVTFVMTLAEESIEIPDYVSYWVTGGFCAWSEYEGHNNSNPVELTRFGETNQYYGLAEVADLTDTSYQITLGYASTSQAPKKGINWEYKSVECAAYPYGENPAFTVNEDGTVNLGTHTFDKKPGPISMIESTTIQITMKQAVPEGVDLYVPNAITGWDLTSKMTPDETRKVWSFAIDEPFVAGTYGGKVIAEREGIEALSWAHTILDDGNGGNYTFAFLKSKHDGAVYNINEEEATEDEETGDMVPAEYDPDFSWKDVETHEVTFEIVLPEDGELEGEWRVIGNFTSWGDGVVLDAGEGKLSKAIKVDFPIASDTYNLEFGICSDSSWTHCFKMQTPSDPSNITVEAQRVDGGKVTITLTGDDLTAMNEADTETRVERALAAEQIEYTVPNA